MKTRLLAAFLFAAMGSGLLVSPAPASASVTQNYPAIMCNSRDVSVNAGSAGAINEYGQVGNIGSQNLMLACPIPTTENQNIDGVVLSFWSNGNNTPNGFYPYGGSSVVAQICDVSPNGGGGFCYGATGMTLGAGVYHLNLPTAGETPNGFNYIVVLTSPVAPSGSLNTIFGYSVTSG